MIYALLMDLRLMTINENLIGINKGDMHMNASRIIEEARKMASEWTEIAKESEIQQKMIEQIWDMVFF